MPRPKSQPQREPNEEMIAIEGWRLHAIIEILVSLPYHIVRKGDFESTIFRLEEIYDQYIKRRVDIDMAELLAEKKEPEIKIPLKKRRRLTKKAKPTLPAVAEKVVPIKKRGRKAKEVAAE